MKEYVDDKGNTFLFDENDKLRPKELKLVESKAAKAPENKADSKPADTK